MKIREVIYRCSCCGESIESKLDINSIDLSAHSWIMDYETNTGYVFMNSKCKKCLEKEEK